MPSNDRHLSLMHNFRRQLYLHLYVIGTRTVAVCTISHIFAQLY